MLINVFFLIISYLRIKIKMYGIIKHYQLSEVFR